MASSAVSGSGVNIHGIISLIEKQSFSIKNKIIDGNYFSENRKNSIVIGNKLAQKLKLKIHSKIILTFQDFQGRLTGAAFRVTGIFKTDSALFDETDVFVRFEDINRIVEIKDNIHEIIIFLNEKEKIPDLKSELSNIFPLLTVESWNDIAPDLDYMNEVTDTMLLIFLVIILAALSFGILNSMLMAALERINEFGMLAAVGMSRTKIFYMIFSETLFVTVVGAVIGMISGFFTILYFEKYGLNLSMFAEGLESFGASAYVYPFLPFNYYWKLTIMVFLTAFLSALYPTYKTLKLKPIQMLRHLQ
jgi:ABC-type lipoprotein release transport system permease subunit